LIICENLADAFVLIRKARIARRRRRRRRSSQAGSVVLDEDAISGDKELRAVVGGWLGLSVIGPKIS
jgi:hypothetical protein